MENVVELPKSASTEIKPNRLNEVYMQILCAWDVFNARLLLGLALLGGVGMWAFEVFRPDFDRLCGAVGYSVLVVIPMIWMAARKE